ATNTKCEVAPPAQTMDNTESIESLFDLFFGVKQFVANGNTEEDDSNQFGQELRLSSKGDSRLQWLGMVGHRRPTCSLTMWPIPGWRWEGIRRPFPGSCPRWCACRPISRHWC